MVLAELLERKKKLLQVLREEEQARKKLVQCLNEIVASAQSSDQLKSGPGPTAVQAVKGMLDDILRKKSGAAMYDKEMFNLCQKAAAALDENLGKPSKSDKLSQNDQANPSTSDTKAKEEEEETDQIKQSQEAGQGKDKNGVEKNGAENEKNGTPPKQRVKPALKPAALGLMKFGQLIALLRENEEEDDTDNMVVILDRLGMLNRVTTEQVKNHKAGKIVAKLSKHRMWEVSSRATKVVSHWKSLLSKSKETSTKDKSSAVASKNKPTSTKDNKSTTKLAKEKSNRNSNSKPTSSSSSHALKKPSPHSSAKTVDMKRPPVKSVSRAPTAARPGKASDKKRPRPSSKSAGKDDESEDDGEDDYDAWMRKYDAKVADSYQKYDQEEEFSRKVADWEDLQALKEEQRERKKKRA